MNSFGNRFRNFMTGRYGVDQFGVFLSIIALLLSFIPHIAGKILSLLLMAYEAFRIFSRNVYGRQKENRGFLKIWSPVKGLFKKRPDYNTHKLFYCPKCRQKLRVPRGKGKVVVTCPKCGEKIHKKT